MDPLDFRLKNLSDPRLARGAGGSSEVLRLAAQEDAREARIRTLRADMRRGVTWQPSPKVVVDKSSDAVRVARMVAAFRMRRHCQS